MSEEWGFQDCARELTLAAIDTGGLSSGGASGVSDFYAQSAKAMHSIDIEIGTYAMRTAARLTTASMRAGMIYPGESSEFAQTVARGVRDVERVVDARPRGIS